jgi:outer membrane protein TolC
MHPPARRSRMKRTPFTSRSAFVFLFSGIVFIATFSVAADPPAPPISFRNAMELALEHSGVMGIAAINQWRARAAYQELKANYIPQLVVGSGLGYSYGFPLTLEGSAPSVVNFNSLSTLFNVPLRRYLAAAKLDIKAASLDVQDKRNAVILDAALTYTQLAQLTNKIDTLGEAQKAAEKAQFVSQQRLEQGIDSELDVRRSQLAAARIRLRIAEAQTQSDVLRQHLASLLGMPAESIAVDVSSVPQIPAISQEDDLPAKAVENSPAVQQAQQKTEAAKLRAQGERESTKYPTADLASQYAYLAKFNNYDNYFKNYTANNLAAGLNIKFPFFNPVQKQKAEEAKADAQIAGKQEQLTREKVREDALQLQRSLRQLSAARDVAKLEWEVSQGDLDGVKARAQTGQVNTRDVQNAELDTDDKHAAYLDADFELSRAELQLLRIIGELEGWALPNQ